MSGGAVHVAQSPESGGDDFRHDAFDALVDGASALRSEILDLSDEEGPLSAEMHGSVLQLLYADHCYTIYIHALC